MESTVSSVGMTATSAVPSTRHFGLSGAIAAAMPSTCVDRSTTWSAEPAASSPSTSTSSGDTMPDGTPPSVELDQRVVRRAAAGQRRGLGLADLDAEDRDDQQRRARRAARMAATHRHRTTIRAQAVQPGDCLPSWRIRGQSTRGPMPPSRAGSRVRITTVLASGMSMPPRPMLRSSGHRDDQQGAQADRHRAGAREDRVAGVLHRDDDGVVVVAAVRAFLPPPVDDEQRVVDRDAEADQRDQELHDEADVHHVGAQQHDRERREDRHERDQQRHEREEGGEEEQQDGQRAEPAEERVDEQARCLRVVAALCQQVVAGDAPVDVGLLAGLLEHGSHRDVGPDVLEAQERLGVDQRVGRAAVVGEEDVVAGVGVAEHAGRRHGRLDVVETSR